LSILGLILLVRGVVFLNMEFTKIIKEVKINLRKRKIVRKAGVKFPPSKFTRNVIYIVKSIWGILIRIRSVLKCLKLQIGKIIIKIKKEVLID